MPGSIEQDIIQLEQQLAEKRAVLGRQGEPPVISEAEPLEKEMLRGVIEERIQEQIPQYQPQPDLNQSTSPAQPLPVIPQQDDSALSYVLPELKDKVQELVNLVFNKGLDEGIKEALKTNNSALIDAFHDILVDELYNTLLERRKLEPVK